jgi:TonB family protein
MISIPRILILLIATSVVLFTFSNCASKPKSSVTPPVVDLERLSSLVQFPQEAEDSLIKGKVVVRVLIDIDGKAIQRKIIHSDNELFNSAVLEAVDKYGDFIPASENGIPIQTWVNIPVNFKYKYRRP